MRKLLLEEAPPKRIRQDLRFPSQQTLLQLNEEDAQKSRENWRKTENQMGVSAETIFNEVVQTLQCPREELFKPRSNGYKFAAYLCCEHLRFPRYILEHIFGGTSDGSTLRKRLKAFNFAEGEMVKMEQIRKRIYSNDKKELQVWSKLISITEPELHRLSPSEVSDLAEKLRTTKSHQRISAAQIIKGVEDYLNITDTPFLKKQKETLAAYLCLQELKLPRFLLGLIFDKEGSCLRKKINDFDHKLTDENREIVVQILSKIKIESASSLHSYGPPSEFGNSDGDTDEERFKRAPSFQLLPRSKAYKAFSCILFSLILQEQAKQKSTEHAFKDIILLACKKTPIFTLFDLV